MRCALCALALLLSIAAAPAGAQVQNGQGVASFNGRRGQVSLQPSDLPAATVFPAQVGDGTTVAFTLVGTLDPTRIAVLVGGIPQVVGTNVSVVASGGSTVLTFAAAPPPGALIQVISGGMTAGLPLPSFGDFVGDGATTTYALPGFVTAPSKVEAWIGGLHQMATSFVVTGNVLTFAIPPPAGAGVEIKVGP